MLTRQLGLALLLAGIVAEAEGQETTKWTGQVTPYVWGAGIGGTVRPFAGAPAFELEKGLLDVLDDLDLAFFLSGLARRNRLVLLGDLSYSSSSRSGQVPPGITAEGKIKQTSLTFLAGYRLHDSPGVSVDALAGGRAWWVSASVQVPLVGIDQTPDLDFVDPIVAARSNIRLGARWSTILYGDIGGFGAGSKLTAQLVGTVNFRASTHLYLSGGYRYLMLDYDEIGTEVDVALSGPLLGATWRF